MIGFQKEDGRVKGKRKYLVAVLALILVVAAVWLRLSPRKETSESTTAYKGTIETYYNFEGSVIAPAQQIISATAPDTVREVYVSPNAQVEKDDRLLKLENGGVVRADRAGEVTGLFVRAEDTVSAGQTLLHIVDLTQLEMEVKVDEYDISAIGLGKAAKVTIEATGQIVDATVEKINKVSSAVGDLSYYTVTLAFDAQSAPGVLPGMRVSAKMLNARAQDVTVLAMSALRFDDYNQPYVLMQDGDKTQQVSVTVGINDGVNVEIISGLTPGESVLEGEKRGTMAEQMMAMREQMMGK